MALPFVKDGVFEEFEVHEDRIIQKGETGILCRGCRRSEGGPVSIKLPDEGAVVSDEVLRTCRRESDHFEKHPHENVVSVLGTGTFHGRPYFALEELRGETLTQLLKDGHRFSTEEILHVGEGVARALRAAAGASILHGALRPSSIVLTPEGGLKLVGFGTPRTLELSRSSPTYLSSLRFQSPEQVQGEPLSTHSDLYSLGIVLYLLATGKTPFDGFESAISLLYQVSYVDPTPPRKAGALIPVELERLILRCLDKRREFRTASPEAFLGEVAAIRAMSRPAGSPVPEDDRGDFEIFEDQILGEGGMGTLYRGRQVSLGRPVAIKVIRGILTHNPEYVQRFRREAELLAQVNDPGIVQVFGTGTWRGRVFYAMELVEGNDLAVLLEEKGTLDVGEILEIAEGVGRALKAAWTYKIVHRDIKPSNILITADHRVKVADFGLAKSFRVPRRDSQLIAGTSEYISPEQAIGLKVDFRSDLYSLGVVLYELASGRPPFRSDDSFTGVIYQHVHLPPPPLSAAVPGLPAPLVELVHRCLAKDPEGRHGSPEEFLDAVRVLRQTLKRPYSARVSPRRLLQRSLSVARRVWTARRRIPLKAGALTAVLAGCLLSGMGLSGLVQEVRRKEAETAGRKSYDLALGLGDYASAARLARETFGPGSPELRRAEQLVRSSELYEQERGARACLLSEDWDGAAAWFRILEAGAAPEERPRFVQALSLCESLARGRRFEKEGLQESALAVYQTLLAQGSPYGDYLRRRIGALAGGER